MANEQEIVEINGIPSQIYRLGNMSSASIIIVIVPGNPGLPGFYIPFAHRLFDLCRTNPEKKKNVAILILSQAGHSPSQKHVFSLNEQIEHKFDAIQQLIPSINQHLILVGHSIGAYMILEMLDRLKNPIDRVFLLFPTIERMAQSQSGQRFIRWFPILIYFLPILVFLLNLFRSFIWLKTKLASFYLRHTPVDDRSILIQVIVNDLMNTITMNNMLMMANEEMRVVDRRNDRIIERYLSKLTFYYGTNDHWVPSDCCQEMQMRYPRGDIVECSNKYLHAFVLQHSQNLAKFVYERLKLI